MFDKNQFAVELVLKNSAIRQSIRHLTADKNGTRAVGTVPCCISPNCSNNGYIDAPVAKIYPFPKNPR